MKARQERKSDVYSKLIAYPPPHDYAAQSAPQYAFKRILLTKSRSPYLAFEDKMSLYHAREYFCNALYAIGIWKAFFADKRAFFLGKAPEEGKADAPSKSGSSQENLTRVKLESLINLVYISLVLEDAYSATTYLGQIEADKFVLDPEKRFTLKMYQAEALFLQQKYKESKQVLQTLASVADSPVQVEHITTMSGTETYQKRVVVQQNVVSLDLVTGNLDAARTGLEHLNASLDITSTNGKELPPCLLLSWIYYHLRTGDKETALELIKRRRYLKSMTNARGGSLLKLTH